jgi:16S rRNA (uracil1498-N3)-methyltransferase
VTPPVADDPPPADRRHPAGPPADAPLVFVDDVDDPQLDPQDRHHLGRVLRVRPGQLVTVSDGRGSWRPVSFGDHLSPEGPRRYVEPSAPLVTIAFALVKGGRPELVTQKLTELGVDRIVPFVAARSVVRWDGDRDAKHVTRLRRVAREAAMQSRRCHLPEVRNVTQFADVSMLTGAAVAERDGPPPTLDHPTILVGPEGGWSADEKGMVAERVGLGDNILRAETAAITAAALLTGLRSGLVRPAAGE